MSDIRVYAKQKSVPRQSDDSWVALRATRDGSAIVVPWYQSLVFESKVFGCNIGSVTTPVTGKVAVDADQPDGAIRVADGYSGLPLFLSATVETGSATLGVGALMFAVSNIDVGNGTSTAETPLCLNLANVVASAFNVRSAYSGNGTDPLTAGNFQELARQSFLLDSDAATSGFVIPRLEYAAGTAQSVPVVSDVGSILSYSEHATNAPSIYASLIWAELAESDFA